MADDSAEPVIDQTVEATNVKVMVRVRLFNKREIDDSQKKREQLRSVVKMRGQTCVIVEYQTDDKGFVHEVEREAFQFDECFWSIPVEQDLSAMPFADQAFVYKRSGLPALATAMKGFNVCIFAYGQTGSGKTYSMLGAMPTDPGVSPRLCDDLFKCIAANAVTVPTTKVQVECMFFEIYNEKVRDLFNKKSKMGEYDAPKIRQHPTKGVFVEGLARKEVLDAESAKALIEKGTKERAMAETKMNAHSSRSHAVFQIRVIQNDALKGTQRVSSINLVDLAGSEKIKKSEAEGETFVEATNINQSLSTLRKVIDALIDNSQPGRKKKTVAPFRESVLTWVLSDSLGGNSKTMMIATISPHVSNLEDTLGTLRYALRAKAIVCQAKVNEEKSAEMVNAMRDEIMKLRQMMAGGGGAGGAGGGMMMPEEIQKEIALREQEVKKMEETQKAITEELESSRKMQQEAEEKLAVVAAQQQELSVQVTEHKRERFATAFRNAFLIAKDKKVVKISNEEMDALKAQAADAATRCGHMEDMLTAERANTTELTSRVAELESAAQAHEEETAAQLGKLTKLTTSLQEDKATLMAGIDRREKEVENLQKRVSDAEAQLLRSHEDSRGLAHILESERVERQKVTETLEGVAMTASHQLDEMRVKKDHYKALAAEEKVRSGAWKSAVSDREADRAQLLATIKAQQHLLDERATLLDMANRERDSMQAALQQAERRAEREQEQARLLHESLVEYQAAASKWMSEHSALEREVARLRMHIDSSRAPLASTIAASPAQQIAQRSSLLPASPLTQRLSSTPRRAHSPASAASAGSPYLRQPSVTTHVSPIVVESHSRAAAAWRSPMRR